MKHYLLAAIVVVLGSACDTQNVAPAAGAPVVKTDKAGDPGSAAPGGAAAPAGLTADSPVKFASLSACLETCEAPGMIETNRATCRLNCDGSYGAQNPVVAGGPDADAIGTAATCLGRCYGSGPTPGACAEGCKHTAAGASPAPGSDVLERLDTCVRTCHADKSVRPTNQATCVLNCGQAARVASSARPASP